MTGSSDFAIQPKTCYSVLCKDAFLKGFVLGHILGVNEDNGVGIYPSIGSHNVIISDTREPSARLTVLSYVVRGGFRVFDLDDYKVRLQVLCHIFKLEHKELSKVVKAWHKDKMFQICASYVAVGEFDRGIVELARIVKEEEEVSLAFKVEELGEFVMGFEEKKFKGLLRYLKEFGSFVYILSGLLNGKVKHQGTKDVKFMTNLLNVVLGVLRSSNNEEALLSVYMKGV